MKYKILKIVFLAWTIIWVFFIVRGLFIKGAVHDYKALLSRSLEGKHSYVTGDSLYEFLAFCNEKLPPKAFYRFIGPDDYSIKRKLAVYYLYPHLEIRGKATYILVFDRPIPEDLVDKVIFKLDDRRYILKIR